MGTDCDRQRSRPRRWQARRVSSDRAHEQARGASHTEHTRASDRRTDGTATSATPQITSHVEADLHHVVVGHHVVLALDAAFACGSGRGNGARGDEVVERGMTSALMKPFWKSVWVTPRPAGRS